MVDRATLRGLVLRNCCQDRYGADPEVVVLACKYVAAQMAQVHSGKRVVVFAHRKYVGVVYPCCGSTLVKLRNPVSLAKAEQHVSWSYRQWRMRLLGMVRRH